METNQNKFRLRALTLGFLAMLVLIVLVVGLGMFGLERLSLSLDRIVSGHSLHSKLAGEMRQATRDRAILLGRIALEEDPFARDELMLRFTDLGRRFGAARTQLLAMSSLVQEERALLEEQRQGVAQVLPLQMQLLDLMAEERHAEAARLLLREVMPLQEKVIETLRRFVEFQEMETAEIVQTAQQERVRFTRLLVGVGALVLLLGFGIAIFVTQRVNDLVERLDHREREARALLENIPDLVWFKDCQSRFQWANSAFMRLTKVAGDKLGMLRDEDIWLGGQAKQCKSDDQEAIENGQMVRIEKTLSTQGIARRFDTSRTPLFDEQGRCMGVLGVAHDITEQRRLTDELKTALHELEFQKFALDQHAIVSIADVYGNITYINDKFCTVSGYSREALLGQNHRLLKSGKHPEAYYTDMWVTISSGRVWRGEVCNRSQSGQFYWVDSTIVPFLDEAGLPYQYVSIRTEITQIKEAQASLQRGKEELERLVVERTGELSEQLHFSTELMEVLPTPLYFKDKHGIYLGVNKAWEEFFGIRREAIVGKVLDVIYPQAKAVAAKHAAMDQELWRHPGRQSYEISIPVADGKLRDTLYNKATFTKADGSVAGLVGSIVDFTERKQAEVELKLRYEEVRELNDKLKEAQNQLLQSEKMASVGQLAAGVAHEINNPIGYVYSNLGTLEEYVQDLFSMVASYEELEPVIADGEVLERVRAAREKIDLKFLRDDTRALMSETREGITRVKKIVQDLKDFSRIDATDEWHWADLQKGIDSTLNIVWNELKYKVEVKKEYADIPEVECRPSQLNQVFMNLLVNAGHAIEEKGVITIRTGQEGEAVWIEIADSGKGIAPEHLTRIFDPFFTTKPVGQGTGLGLSLSYGIVQKHGGRIEVKSEPGKGTTFSVWLPIKQSA
ncbi:MAG: PAS domain S-box protein [Pseudomonadota bacterium]